MLTKEIIIEKLKHELPFLNDKYSVNKIGLFGSFAHDSGDDDSDVDLVVEFEKSNRFSIF